MLQSRGNHVIPRPEQAGNGKVQRLGGTGRERHAQWVPKAEQLCNLLAAAVHHARRGQPQAMRAAAAGSDGVHGVKHGLRHTARLLKAGRRAVQIDHSSRTPFSRASVSRASITPPAMHRALSDTVKQFFCCSFRGSMSAIFSPLVTG